MSQREAAAVHGIAKSTLGDKIRGKSAAKVLTKGKPLCLSKDIEARYVFYVHFYVILKRRQ